MYKQLRIHKPIIKKYVDVCKKKQMINELFDKLSIYAMINSLRITDLNSKEIIEKNITYDDLRKNYTKQLFTYLQKYPNILKEYLHFNKVIKLNGIMDRYFIDIIIDLPRKLTYISKYLSYDEIRDSQFAIYIFLIIGNGYDYCFVNDDRENEQTDIVENIINPWIEKYNLF